MDWIVRKSSALHDEVVLDVPGDKSISHRAVMLASIANGVSRIDGFLDGADTRATVNIMRQLGVTIIEHSRTSLEVHGVGLHGLRKPSADLDCGNAGTGMRLLAGLLCGQNFPSTLTGDASLSKRPMQRIIQPLQLMGAQIGSENNQRPPLKIQAVDALHGVSYRPAVASAQVKSAVLLAGLYANGTTRVDEIVPTRDYTEQLLREMGWPIEFGPGFAQVQGKAELRAVDINVPGDFSSAAFPLIAAIISENTVIKIRNVGLATARIGLLEALRLMGADIKIENQRDTFAGPVGDVVASSSKLHAIDLPTELVADMIDEIPIFCVAAARANGVTRIRGAAELRVKESDRIHAIASNLERMGVRVTQFDDGMDIEGGCELNAADLQAFDDHRIAMSLSVLAGQVEAVSQIRGVENVATSFPKFVETMSRLGYAIEVTA